MAAAAASLYPARGFVSTLPPCSSASPMPPRQTHDGDDCCRAARRRADAVGRPSEWCDNPESSARTPDPWVQPETGDEALTRFSRKARMSPTNLGAGFEGPFPVDPFIYLHECKPNR